MSDGTRALDRSLIRGLAWTGGVRWLSQLLSWSATLVVARLLTPADYGLVGMALVYVGIAQLVGEGGLTGAIIQRRDLNDERVAQLGALAVLQSVMVCAVSMVLAGPIAGFFGEAAVRATLAVLSVTVVTKSLQVVPRARLARALEFRRIAWLDGTEAVSLTAATLAFALLGMRHWALALGLVTSGVVTSAVALRWHPHRLAWPRDWRALLPTIRLGWHLVGTHFAWYAYTNADFAVVGRVLGSAALGAYTFAWNIANVPVEKVSALVGRVTPAVFAAVQRDAAALRRYLAGLTEGLALVTLPACVGLALVAGDLVPVLLGDAWASAVTPLRLLALYAAVRSLVTLAPQLLVVTGRSGLNLAFSALAAVVLPLVFVVASRWGTTGVALGWLVGYPLIAVPTVVRSALNSVGMSWTELGRAVRPAALAALAMTLVVLGVAQLVPGAWSPVARLLVEAAAGAAAYAAAVALLHGRRIATLYALVLGRDPGAPRPAPVHATAARPAAPRLLLISFHFPPDPAVGGRRWQKLTRFAAERGWAVDVIARDPAQLEHADPDLMAGLPDGVRVFGVPERRLWIERLEHVAWRALHGLRRGVRAGAAARERPVPSSIHCSAVRRRPRTLRDVLRWYFAWADHARGRSWARGAARLALAIVEPSVHRAVITCGPPHGAHLAGERVAGATGLPLVLDFRDPWSLVQRVPEAVASPVWFRLARRDERTALRRAALVVANTEPARDAMRRAYPGAATRIIAVPNGCDDEPVPSSRHGTRFVVAYAGTIYLDRDPRPLFRAAAQVARELDLTPADFGVELMGGVQRFDGMGVAAIAREEGAERFVRLHPVGSRGDTRDWLAGAGLLVVLPQDSDLAIPAKVFEYMEFDAWVLALAEPGSATERLLRSSAADVVSPRDVEAIAAVLRQRYEAYRRGERPVRLAGDARFSRRAQAEVLFAAIEALTGAPRHAATSPLAICAAS